MVGIALGNIQRDFHCAQLLHEARRFMVIVRSQRDPLGPTKRIHEVNGGLPFRRTGRLRHIAVNHQRCWLSIST
jgi:hypothetical protein